MEYLELQKSQGIDKNKEDANVVNEGKYESLIDNYSYYWICSAFTSKFMRYVNPLSRDVAGVSGNAFGVRVLVTLPSSIKVVEGGEKTVISRDNEYTYKVWNIKTN